VELYGQDFLPRLRDHRVALKGTGAALPGEVNGGARERTADPAAAEARAGNEAGYGPDPSSPCPQLCLPRERVS
jgi:hypothetical protein